MRIIAGLHKNRPIKAPEGLATRPTAGRLREALFNICQGKIEGARFLDLFAGSGAMGLEALSRGAKSAVFIDNGRECLRCIEENTELLKVERQSQAVYGDVFDQLKRLTKRNAVFDIIYADPPYAIYGEGEEEGVSLTAKVLAYIDEHIDLLAPEGDLFLEDARDAMPEAVTEKLVNLRLKSTRRLGRSALQHYVRTSMH